LRRGPNDAEPLQWLWQHWCTMLALRNVVEESAARQDRPRRPNVGGRTADKFLVGRLVALARAGGDPAGFPALRFDLRPSYDPP